MDADYERILKENVKKYAQEWLEKNPLGVGVGVEEKEGHYKRAIRETREKAEEWAQWHYLRWKCETDLFFLATEILGLNRAKGMSGRKRVDERLHRGLCEELSRDSDVLILYPRNHMKSTFLKLYAIQCVLKNPEVRIGIWSRTTTLAKKELKSIKAYFRNDNLLRLFPDKVKKNFQVDNAQELTVFRGETSVVQENQIEIWGVDSGVTGHHYDLHLYDDIIDSKSVKSATGITQIREWWEDMQAVKDLGALEKMVGTRKHVMDIYNHILQEKMFKPENIIIRKAVEGGKPIYSFYTLKDLAKLKKRMGANLFASEMLNKCVAGEDKIFIPPYPLYNIQKAPRERKYYMAVDPAATANKYSDQTGIAIGFMDKHKPDRMYAEEAYGVRLESSLLCAEIVRKLVTYRPATLGIELGLQRAILPLLLIQIREWEYTHPGEFIKPHFLEISTGNTAKAVKIERILGASMRDERILFPGVYHGDLLRVSPQFDELFRQMEFYNPNSNANADDIIDAVNMLLQTVDQFAVGHWDNVDRSNPEGGLSREFILKNYRQNKPKTGWERKFA